MFKPSVQMLLEIKCCSTGLLPFPLQVFCHFPYRSSAISLTGLLPFPVQIFCHFPYRSSAISRTDLLPFPVQVFCHFPYRSSAISRTGLLPFPLAHSRWLPHPVTMTGVSPSPLEGTVLGDVVDCLFCFFTATGF